VCLAKDSLDSEPQKESPPLKADGKWASMGGSPRLLLCS